MNTIIAICLWIAFGATSGFVAFVIFFLALAFTFGAAVNWAVFTSIFLANLFKRRS